MLLFRLKQVSMQQCTNLSTVFYIFLSVNVLLYVMCIERVASSKQRSSLRRAITDEKKKLGKCIQQYNSVVRDVDLDLPLLQDQDIFEGKFPWSPLSSESTVFTTMGVVL